MKTLAILNPRAGLAAQRALEALRRAAAAWDDPEVRITSAPGDARAWAAEAARGGFDVALALGGDGTANEVASALIGSRTALGVVPVGSGNGLARTLRVPLRPDRALDALRAAVPLPMDVGMVNGRPFLNVAGAGFDAEIGARFHAHGRQGGRRGVFTYVRLGLGRSLSYRAESWTLQAGGERFEGRALVVAFVNGRQYGGAAVIAPGARLDDGLLDVVVVEDGPILELLLNAPRMFLGGLERFRRYRHLAASEAVLTASAPVLYHRDGEPEPASDRLEVGVRRGALQVLVPRQTAEDPNGPFGARRV